MNRKSSPRKSSESQMGLAVELGWEIRVKLLLKLKIIRFTGNMLKHTDRVPGSLTVEVGWELNHKSSFQPDAIKAW